MGQMEESAERDDGALKGSVERLASSLKEIDAALDEPALDPDPASAALSRARGRADEIRRKLETEVLGAFGAIDGLLGADPGAGGDGSAAATAGLSAALFGRAVSQVAARVAVLASAAGDPEAGARLLARAIELAEDGSDAKAELQAGLDSPAELALLVRARRHLRREEREAAVSLARLLADTAAPALRAAARGILAAPRPITSAPALFRVNGCGVALYGSRDHQPDGSYVATYCISLLFIPVFPLSAYRVKEASSNSYYFYAREALGPVAKIWRSVVLAGAGLAIAGGLLAKALSG